MFSAKLPHSRKAGLEELRLLQPFKTYKTLSFMYVCVCLCVNVGVGTYVGGLGGGGTGLRMGVGHRGWLFGRLAAMVDIREWWLL